MRARERGKEQGSAREGKNIETGRKKERWKDEVFRYVIFFPEYFLLKIYKTFKDYFIGESYLFTFHYFPSHASWGDKIRVEIATFGKKME